MFKELINTFFPIPNFISSVSFGVDISDESVKFVEIQKVKSIFKVKKYGERKIPAGIIESGKIKDSKKLEEILKSLKEEEGIRSVRVSLPEEQIYLFKLHLEKAGLKDVREGIELSLEENVPILAEDAIFDYDFISQNDTSIDVQVVVIVKNIVESYVSVFKNAGIAIQSLELEAEAVSRVVIKKDDKDTSMIVDFGNKRTGISIISNGMMMFTGTVDMGGETLTKLIEKNFKISFSEAEQLKQKYGLERNSKNQEVFSVLLNGVSILRDEITRHYVYWHTHKDDDGKDRPQIKKIILCGGDSNLIGLKDYLAISMKQRVEVANVWVNMVNTDQYIPEINFKESLSYATALGLALGNFDYD